MIQQGEETGARVGAGGLVAGRDRDSGRGSVTLRRPLARDVGIDIDKILQRGRLLVEYVLGCQLVVRLPVEKTVTAADGQSHHQDYS